jgi:hypothetical protein
MSGESTVLNQHRYGSSDRLSLIVSRLFDLLKKKKAIVSCGSVRVATGVITDRYSLYLYYTSRSPLDIGDKAFFAAPRRRENGSVRRLFEYSPETSYNGSGGDPTYRRPLRPDHQVESVCGWPEDLRQDRLRDGLDRRDRSSSTSCSRILRALSEGCRRSDVWRLEGCAALQSSSALLSNLRSRPEIR